VFEKRTHCVIIVLQGRFSANSRFSANTFVKLMY